MKHKITEYTVSLPTHYDDGYPIPESKRYFNPGGWYPARYWEIEEVEEEHVSRYISGQVPFIAEHSEKPRQCKRCLRAVKRQYTHCYRCYSYLQKKKDGEIL